MSKADVMINLFLGQFDGADGFFIRSTMNNPDRARGLRALVAETKCDCFCSRKADTKIVVWSLVSDGSIGRRAFVRRALRLTHNLLSKEKKPIHC
jgi:hypothetical protein